MPNGTPTPSQNVNCPTSTRPNIPLSTSTGFKPANTVNGWADVCPPKPNGKKQHAEPMGVSIPGALPRTPTAPTTSTAAIPLTMAQHLLHIIVREIETDAALMAYWTWLAMFGSGHKTNTIARTINAAHAITPSITNSEPFLAPRTRRARWILVQHGLPGTHNSPRRPNIQSPDRYPWISVCGG